MFAAGGFSFAGTAPNQGIMFVQLKDFDERPRRGAFGAGGRRPAVRRVQPDHRRDGDAVPAAVDQRPRAVRRLHLRAARSERRADREPRGGGAAAGRAGQPDARADGAVHAVHRERSAAGGEHRSRAGEEPRHVARRHHRHDAGAARIGLRQRLRLQQPVVPRLRAGRSAVPLEPGGHRAVSRAHRRRADDAAQQHRRP